MPTLDETTQLIQDTFLEYFEHGDTSEVIVCLYGMQSSAIYMQDQLDANCVNLCLGNSGGCQHPEVPSQGSAGSCKPGNRSQGNCSGVVFCPHF